MSIKKIISVASAKGGVGKSTITALLAMNFAKNFKVGILDADIYGPNQHILFNVANKKPNYIKDKDKTLMEPIEAMGVKLNSMGFILDDDRAAIWRGPMLSGAIKQLMSLTIWGELDYLFIDMPPGTGDAYLTVASEVKPDHSLLVTTPNKLAIHDTLKSVSFFNKLDINLLGFIENNTSNLRSLSARRVYTPRSEPNRRGPTCPTTRSVSVHFHHASRALMQTGCARLTKLHGHRQCGGDSCPCPHDPHQRYGGHV